MTALENTTARREPRTASERISRWSRNSPVFCPSNRLAMNFSPFSLTVSSGGGSSGFGPTPEARGRQERRTRPVGTGTAKAERRRRDRVPDAAPLSFDEKQLFEKLRQVRKELAEERSVPPYVVFSDATLRDLVRVRPASLEAMLEVKGVGRAKLEAFGETFLQALK